MTSLEDVPSGEHMSIAELAERLGIDWAAPWASHEVFPDEVILDTDPVAIARSAARRGHSNRDNKRRRMWIRDRRVCQLCAQRITLDETTMDRIIPGAQGGAYNIENVQSACKPCNGRKADQVVPRFAYATPDQLALLTQEEYVGGRVGGYPDSPAS